MRRTDFAFDLPPELIAQFPREDRAGGRLLVVDGVASEYHDGVVRRLPELLRPGDLMVFNDTKVIPARLFGHKKSGGRVEVLIERVLGTSEALAHIRANKAPQTGTVIILENDTRLLVVGQQDDGLYRIESGSEDDIMDILTATGRVPLPPYIKRSADNQDSVRYQTVYARHPGAVAAPTAGLHFDDELLAEIARHDVAKAYLTLHVGAGTFQPVRSEEVEDHAIHAEYMQVSAELCAAVAAAQARGGRIIAVGTTAARALESAAVGGRCRPYQGDTRLFIYPGHRFRVVDALVTNFHLPESSLLMLVAAFAGRELVLRAYLHAIAEEYRFFSYGDAMWVTPSPEVRF